MADKIDRMLDTLREALPEITWDRDAVSEDAETDTGSLELTGSRGFYSDGRLVAMAVKLDVWVKCQSSGTGVLEKMADVLQQWADEDAFCWSFPERGYVYEVDAVVWRWHCEADWGPEDFDPEEEADEEADAETDG